MNCPPPPLARGPPPNASRRAGIGVIGSLAYPPRDRAMFLNRVVSASHTSSTTPVGPLRCFATISSAIPFFSSFAGSFIQSGSPMW